MFETSSQYSPLKNKIHNDLYLIHPTTVNFCYQIQWKQIPKGLKIQAQHSVKDSEKYVNKIVKKEKLHRSQNVRKLITKSVT